MCSAVIIIDGEFRAGARLNADGRAVISFAISRRGFLHQKPGAVIVIDPGKLQPQVGLTPKRPGRLRDSISTSPDCNAVNRFCVLVATNFTCSHRPALPRSPLGTCPRPGLSSRLAVRQREPREPGDNRTAPALAQWPRPALPNRFRPPPPAEPNRMHSSSTPVRSARPPTLPVLSFSSLPVLCDRSRIIRDCASSVQDQWTECFDRQSHPRRPVRVARAARKPKTLRRSERYLRPRERDRTTAASTDKPAPGQQTIQHLRLGGAMHPTKAARYPL